MANPLVTAWLVGGAEPDVALEAASLLLAVAYRRPTWQDEAECRLPEHSAVSWFPNRGEDPEPARVICAGCPVREPCLEYAVTGAERGIWGGTNYRERHAIRQQRKASAA